MREILFKAKREDNGEWVEGYFCKAKYYRTEKELFCWITVPHPESDYLPSDKYMVCPETVCQYTGLKDKNGKKIWENDIIKIPDDYDKFGHNAGEFYEIYFCYGGFRLKPKYSKARGYWLEDDETVEVIGNIFDNPELMESE